MQENIIRRYIRDPETNQPRGLAIIRKDEETKSVHYGFSLCNTRFDKWCPKKAFKIAVARSYAPVYKLPQVPDRETAVLDAFEDLSKRAIKYFKDIPAGDIVLSAANVCEGSEN